MCYPQAHDCLAELNLFEQVGPGFSEAYDPVFTTVDVGYLSSIGITVPHLNLVRAHSIRFLSP